VAGSKDMPDAWHARCTFSFQTGTPPARLRLMHRIDLRPDLPIRPEWGERHS